MTNWQGPSVVLLGDHKGQNVTRNSSDNTADSTPAKHLQVDNCSCCTEMYASWNSEVFSFKAKLCHNLIYQIMHIKSVCHILNIKLLGCVNYVNFVRCFYRRDASGTGTV